MQVGSVVSFLGSATAEFAQVGMRCDPTEKRYNNLNSIKWSFLQRNSYRIPFKGQSFCWALSDYSYTVRF